MKTRKRTEKAFTDYNDYKAGPFGLKWGTAFAIDELNKVIEDNKIKENVNIKEMPQMSRDEIDKVLQIAFLKTKRVSIQLNIKDDLGKYGENTVGHFEGFADHDHVYIDNNPIGWTLIRNMYVVD